VELTLQIPAEVTSGTISVDAYEPATGTTVSNSVTTLINPAAAPITGSGSLASGSQGIPGWIVASLVAGGIIGLAAAARTAAPRRTR